MKVFNKLKTPLSEKKDDLLRTIDASKGIIADLQHQKDQLDLEINVAKNNLGNIEFHIKESKQELESLKVKKQKLDEDVQFCYKTWQVNTDINKDLLQEQDKIKNAIAGSKEVYNKQVEDLKKSYESIEKALFDEAHSMNEEINKKEKALEVVKSQELESEKKKNEYNSLIQKLNGEITDLVNKKNKMLDIETANLAIQDKLIKEIEALKNSKDVYLLEISDLKDKKEVANKELKVKEDRLKELEDRAISRIERERRVEEAAEKIKEAYKKAGVEIKL
jgi:chromosome segregation ATPase